MPSVTHFSPTDRQLEEKQRNAQLLPEEVSRLTEEVSLKADLVRQREQEQRDRHAKREEKLSSFQSLARLYGEKLGMHFVHTPSDGSAEEKIFGGVRDTYGKKWQVGDIIGVFLDTNDRTIGNFLLKFIIFY